LRPLRCRQKVDVSFPALEPARVDELVAVAVEVFVRLTDSPYIPGETEDRISDQDYCQTEGGGSRTGAYNRLNQQPDRSPSPTSVVS